MKKYTDLDVPIEQVMLQLAKDEYPNEQWQIVYHNDRLRIVRYGHGSAPLIFELDDATIMPIWRREALNYVKYLLVESGYTARQADYADATYLDDIDIRDANGTAFKTSLSLESIVRAICDMKHPKGIKL